MAHELVWRSEDRREDLVLPSYGGSGDQIQRIRHFYHSSHRVFKNTKDFILKVILKYSGSGSEDLRGGLPLGAEVERDLQEYRTFYHSFSRC